MWFNATPLTLVNRPPMMNPAVRLDGDGADGIAGADAGLKSVSSEPSGVQAGDVSEIGVAVDGGEIAADDHLAVRRCDGEGIHGRRWRPARD